MKMCNIIYEIYTILKPLHGRPTYLYINLSISIYYAYLKLLMIHTKTF